MKNRFVQHFTRALIEGDYDEIERMMEYVSVDRERYAAVAREMYDDDFDRLEEAYQFGVRKKGFFSSEERDKIIRFTKALEKASYAYQL